MVIVPAIHNLDSPHHPEQKRWGWHRVSELVEAVNYKLNLIGEQPVTPATLYDRYGHLNKFKDSFAIGVTALPTRKGVLGDHSHEFITPRVDLGDIEFVPAGWGCEILKSLEPVSGFTKFKQKLIGP